MVDAQIEELEKILPLVHVLITNHPRLQDVRTELKEVARTVEQAQDGISRLQKSFNGARIEALNRILLASYQAAAGDVIGPAVDALATLGLVVKKTIDELPQTGKAPNTAAVAPIGLIHDALIAGWGKAPLHLSNASTCHAIRTSGRIPIPRF